MKKEIRIYVDTSVIGGCFDDEFDLWSKGLMDDFRNGNFKPVISEIVAAEVNEAPQFVIQLYQEILGWDHEYIEISEEAIELLSAYMERGILSHRFRNDMLHIALATVVSVDVLVSWNFKHIVRFEKIRKFNSVNLELGYKTLDIYTPREVTNYGEKSI